MPATADPAAATPVADAVPPVTPDMKTPAASGRAAPGNSATAGPAATAGAVRDAAATGNDEPAVVAV